MIELTMTFTDSNISSLCFFFILVSVFANVEHVYCVHFNIYIFHRAFTHRAIQITRCIYETEKKKEDQISKEKNEKELGEPVGHAGRLLLNHGYLEGAITTENKTFIDNDTVRRIQSKMWYGEEELSWRQVIHQEYKFKEIHLIKTSIICQQLQQIK